MAFSMVAAVAVMSTLPARADGILEAMTPDARAEVAKYYDVEDVAAQVAKGLNVDRGSIHLQKVRSGKLITSLGAKSDVGEVGHWYDFVYKVSKGGSEYVFKLPVFSSAITNTLNNGRKGEPIEGGAFADKDANGNPVSQEALARDFPSPKLTERFDIQTRFRKWSDASQSGHSTMADFFRKAGNWLSPAKPNCQ